MEAQLTVCNIDLHNVFQSNTDVFFDRVRHLTQMRTKESGTFFSYYITDEDELNELKQLQKAIKTGRINFLDHNGKSPSKYIFAIGMNKKVINWLYNCSPNELEKQLTVWMGALYFLDVKSRAIYGRQFHKRLLSKAKKIVRERFSKYFRISQTNDGFYQLDENFDISYDEILKKYNLICQEYYGKKAPYPLTNPYGSPVRDHSPWGQEFDIKFEYSFMEKKDWESIVINGVKDNLRRAESLPHLIKDWKEVINMHEIHAHHVYNNKERIPETEYKTQKEGYIYLLSNKSFKKNLYKIGLTTRDVEERINELYTTGVPCKFEIEFKVEVNNLYNIEKAIHHELRKYRFDNEREFFLGEKTKFVKTIKQFKNLR